MKKTVTLLIMLLCSFQIYSQDFNEIIIANTTNWVNPKPIDLNGDGHTDVVSVSRDGSIAWWQKDDSMNFTKNEIADFTNPSWKHFDIYDIDNDSDLDIVVCDGTAKIFYNDGNLNFTSNFIGNHPQISNVVAGDFNGDGYGDFISTSTDTNGDLKLWLNNSNTSFSESVIGNLPVKTGNVVVNDIDDDGDLDILLSINSYYQGNKVKCYINDGNANFSELTTISNVGANWKIKVLDYDNDGYKDFVVARSFSIVLFENDGNLNFTSSVLTSVNNDGLKDISIIDSDNDGDNDIVSVFSPVFGDNFLGFYINDGSENFSLYTLGNLNGGEYITTHDFNGNGYSDLIVASEFTDDPIIHENLGSNTFNQTILDTALISPQSFYTGDMNDDGLNDIVTTSNEHDSEIALWTNLGNFIFERQIIDNLLHPTLNGPQSINYAQIVDENNDGYNDILATANAVSPIWGGIYLYSSDGMGNFTKSTILSSSENIRNAFTIDIENDGYLDIVYSLYGSSGSIIYLRNNGDSTYQSVTVSSTLDDTICNGFIDVNNDGFKDFITDKDVYFQNNGSNNFSEISLPTSGQFFDIDGDGDFDILSNSFDTSTSQYILAWYENNGTGTFSENQITTNSTEIYEKFTLQDFDNDGDVDFIAAPNLFYWENNGNQSFTETVINTNQGNSVSHILNTDLDGDGKRDVITSYLNYPFTIWNNDLTLSTIDFEHGTSKIILYPNPTTDYLYIHSNSDIKDIEVYSLQGQKIESSYKRDRIDVSTLPSGLYFLKVVDVSNKKQTIKFIKK